MIVRGSIWHDPFQFYVPLQLLVKLQQVVEFQSSVSPHLAGNLLLPTFKLPANSTDLSACFDLPSGLVHPLFAV